MNDIVNPLQNTSYTNRDFVSVYTELLNLIPKLTNKWNPATSNESDPGVVLLKLNALIADKCNYAIDKNILECFPLSVTQDKNARQLFAQLGYYMHWYRSATTNISLAWSGDTPVPAGGYNIPAFTMVSNEDNSIVYTLLGNAIGGSTLNVGDMLLTNSVLAVNAIQGIAVKYDINGRTNIQVSDLDDKNRIYFDGLNIAENGIFINNEGAINFDSWHRVDNLYYMLTDKVIISLMLI